MVKSAEVERWFKTAKPSSEAAMRKVRDVVLGADPSMRERVQYGVTFSSSKAVTSPRSSGIANLV